MIWIHTCSNTSAQYLGSSPYFLLCLFTKAEKLMVLSKSRYKTSETDSIKSQISSKTSRGKKDSTKRRHQRHHQRQPGKQLFPYRWSPASLRFNIYFYLFLYLYITKITILNGTQHLKITKEAKQKSRLRTASNKITRRLQVVCGRPTLALSSTSVPQTLSCSVCTKPRIDGAV